MIFHLCLRTSNGLVVPGPQWAIKPRFFLVKTSLGALRKNVVGIKLDSRVTLGSVTVVRVKSARITAIWIGDYYIDRWNCLWVWQKTISSIGIRCTIKSNFNTLFNIIRVWMCYKIYLKKIIKLHIYLIIIAH